MKYPNANDGDYWLYPPPFNGKKVKIYCSMGTVPTEYVTLRAFNRGSIPKLKFETCEGLETTATDEGSVVFGRVRVNIEV